MHLYRYSLDKSGSTFPCAWIFHILELGALLQCGQQGCQHYKMKSRKILRDVILGDTPRKKCQTPKCFVMHFGHMRYISTFFSMIDLYIISCYKYQYYI